MRRTLGTRAVGDLSERSRGAEFAELRSRGIRPLTFLVVALCLMMAGAALLKSATLGLESVSHWGFTRPALSDGALTEPVSPVHDPELQEAVTQAAEGGAGLTSAYVWDLGTGASAELLPTRPMAAASLAKLPVLVEVLRQERLGSFRGDQMLEIRPEHWADGAGVLQAQVGQSYSVDELSRLMIERSDNIAARVLMELVGVDQVNESMLALGLQQTHLEPLGTESADRPPHQTSALDMARLLAIVASGGLVDVATSERALQLLETKQANAWLAQDLPWWVRIAHKWGELPTLRHDAGIVYTPRGSYVVVVMTEGRAPREASRVISRVSRAVFDHLGADGG
jgi:beta-lactamase class A